MEYLTTGRASGGFGECAWGTTTFADFAQRAGAFAVVLAVVLAWIAGEG